MHQFRAQTSVLQTAERLRCLLILLMTFEVLFVACPAKGSDYFVAPNGNDNNDGSIDHPFKTIDKAVEKAQAGDTIFLRGGIHNYSQTVNIEKSGELGSPITLQAYQDEAPILDFNEQPIGTNERGIFLKGSYWHLKGFIIQYAGDNGLNITDGAHNILEQLVTRYNADSGLQLHTGASYNIILNCDSYFNCDPQNNGENADGFAAKFNLGAGNVFQGCRAWGNSDDGWDFWDAGNAVTVEDCWAFRNGINVWGIENFQGDGNGFKLGRGTGSHVVVRCLAYDLPHNGFDRNGNTTGVTVYNCTSVKNLGSNYRFDLSSSSFVLRNNISHIGTNTIAANVDDTYNTWNSGFTVSDADFASLDPNGIDGPREPDGGLPKLSFLRLYPNSSLIDAGIDVNQPFYGDAPDLGAFEHLDGDSEPDGDVDWVDLACLASNWLDTGCGDCNGADFDGDGEVNLYDFAKLAANWLKY